MPSVTLRIGNAPGKQAALSNCVFLHPEDVVRICPRPSQTKNSNYVKIKGFILSWNASDQIKKGTIGLNTVQRIVLDVAVDETVTVTGYFVDENKPATLSRMKLEVDVQVKKAEGVPVDCKQLNEQLMNINLYQHFTLSQRFLVELGGVVLQIRVAEVQVIDIKSLTELRESCGMLVSQTQLEFVRAANASIRLVGGTSSGTSLIRPDWNFEKMGIGGLDAEFSQIFRRAFASRVFPPAIVAKLGVSHVKGLLLYGPPGTGKTLMARQIGKMLNGKKPKVVNGPEILNKYVGQSEENIRNLFAEAEAEYKQRGDDSELHIIIFDEIDAICKARGTTGGNTGVGDTVVNQLLSKIDGVDSLNNILVIGMTNRKDLIDEALLRPGRLEVHVEIGLPNLEGRRQILNIHTQKMRDNGFLAPDVDLDELAALTKNFTGSEIEGLVKSSASFAFNRQIDASDLNKPLKEDQILITKDDFMQALKECQPAFGFSMNELQSCITNGIIEFGAGVSRVLKAGRSFIQQVLNSDRSPIVSVLLEGSVGSGKTSIAAKLALEAGKAGFPFVKLISPDEYLGYSESAKIAKMYKVFQDAYKSPLSVLVFDDIERLIDYVPIGPRFSNAILQILLVCLKKVPTGKKLLIIGTTSNGRVLQEMEMKDSFSAILQIPNVSGTVELTAVLKQLNIFSDSEISTIAKSNVLPEIPIKQLLMLTEMARQGDVGSLSDSFIQCAREIGMSKTF